MQSFRAWKSSSALFTFTCLVCGLVLAGCGKTKRRPDSWGSSVQGTVTVAGQPLGSGMISFIPLASEEEGGRPGVAQLDQAGNYWVGNANPGKPSGLIPGSYRVIFLSMDVDPNGTGTPIAKLRIPEELTDSKTTPYRCEIRAGENRLDFELTDEPKLTLKSR